MFTLKEGFLEALVRGMKAELLVKEDYVKLRQCDSLVDLKLYLVTQGEQSTLDMTNTRVGIERLSL
jgi:vacuolar-type H+-ATPase subunit C/Vma6